MRSYGEEIDLHDVVIRMGHVPIKNYGKFVGYRSDFTWYRPGALNRGKAKYRASDLSAYLCKNGIHIQNSLGKRTRYRSVPASIACDTHGGKHDFAFHLLSDVYSSMSPGRKSTSGTLFALRLAFSRFCSRLDIYGISSGGGGTYFEPEALTKMKHGTELDSWLLHYLMLNYSKELNMCI